MKDHEPYDTYELEKKIKEVNRSISEIIIQIDKLKKTKNKVIKTITPIEKKTNKETQQQTTLFTKTDILNSNLISFFNLDPSKPVSIMDVQKMFNHYITLNNLRDPVDRYKINPNQELKNLFELEEGDELTFLNLSHFVRHAVRRKSI